MSFLRTCLQGGSPMDDLDLSKLSFRDADESVYVKVDAVENKEPCASRSRCVTAAAPSTRLIYDSLLPERVLPWQACASTRLSAPWRMADS